MIDCYGYSMFCVSYYSDEVNIAFYSLLYTTFLTIVYLFMWIFNVLNVHTVYIYSVCNKWILFK